MAKSAMASRNKQTQTRLASKNWLAMALLGCCLVATAIYAGLYLQRNNTQEQPDEKMMPIRVIEITGMLEQVTKEQILAVIRKQVEPTTEDNKQGVDFLSTDLAYLESQLETLAWVYRSQLRRVWPDRLVIEIEEQKAVAVWNAKALVNQYGELFIPDLIPDTVLPVLTGPDIKLAEMLDTFQTLQLKFESAGLQLTELHLSPRYSWQLKLANQVELAVGRKDLIGRVDRFISLYPLLQSESQTPIERVDLRYDTGIAVLRMDSKSRQASL